MVHDWNRYVGLLPKVLHGRYLRLSLEPGHKSTRNSRDKLNMIGQSNKICL
jgi:hypothetical protein